MLIEREFPNFPYMENFKKVLDSLERCGWEDSSYHNDLYPSIKKGSMQVFFHNSEKYKLFIVNNDTQNVIEV